MSAPVGMHSTIPCDPPSLVDLRHEVREVLASLAPFVERFKKAQKPGTDYDLRAAATEALACVAYGASLRLVDAMQGPILDLPEAPYQAEARAEILRTVEILQKTEPPVQAVGSDTHALYEFVETVREYLEAENVRADAQNTCRHCSIHCPGGGQYGGGE